MSINPDILAKGIESWKLWSFLITSFVTVVLGIYKAYQWVKGIRTEDLTEVKSSLIEVRGSLEKATAKIEETSAAQLRETTFQTQSLVRELSELRGIMQGAFYAAPKMMPVRKRPVPKKRKSAASAQMVLDTDE